MKNLDQVAHAERLKNKKRAFTLAEVLITLAIIGVVAALTIPTVMNSTQKRIYVTQLKKNYNYIQNAFRDAMARDGVFTLADTSLFIKSSNSQEESPIYSDAGVQEELKKIFNISQIYDGVQSKIPNKCEGDENCIKYSYLSGTEPDKKQQAIVLADGTIIYLSLMKNINTAKCNGNPCKSLKDFQASARNTSTKLWQVAGAIIIDVNGIKEPNKWGRDFFRFYIGNDGNLYPINGIEHRLFNDGIPLANYTTGKRFWEGEHGKCNPNSTQDKNGEGCAARIMEEGWEMNY